MPTPDITSGTNTQDPHAIAPQRLIDALTANGWTTAGQRTGRYTRLNWPGETDPYTASLVVPTNPDYADYTETLGGVLAQLARQADTGRRAAAVLASLGGCDQARNKITAPDTPALTSDDITEATFPLLVQVADRDSLDINDDDIRDGHHRIEGYAWLAEQAYRLGAASRDKAKSSDDEGTSNPGHDPSADPGPTHRAQSGRLACQISADLRQWTSGDAELGALLREAADKLDRQAAIVADECMARDAAQRAADRAENTLKLLSSAPTPAPLDLSGAAQRTVAAGPLSARLAAIAPGVDPGSDTWLPADAIHGWAHAAGRPDVTHQCGTCSGTVHWSTRGRWEHTTPPADDHTPGFRVQPKPEATR